MGGEITSFLVGTSLKKVMGFEFGLWGGGKGKNRLENIPIKGTYLIKDKKSPIYVWSAQEKIIMIKHCIFIVYIGFQNE